MSVTYCLLVSFILLLLDQTLFCISQRYSLFHDNFDAIYPVNLDVLVSSKPYSISGEKIQKQKDTFIHSFKTKDSKQSFAINLFHKKMPFTGEDIYN